MPVKDMAGQVFGKLYVESFAGTNKHGAALWNCTCDCGESATVVGFSMRQGHTKSCGCLNKETARALNYSHGQAAGNKTPTYRTWRLMVRRCHNEADERYPEYGALGIEVCPRWRESFQNFYADMGERPQGRTIDRKDSTKGYAPDNCRWATASEQCQNRSAMKTNTSGYKNVCWLASYQRWRVAVALGKKKFYFGHYVDLDLAGLVAAEAREVMHGKFANHKMSRFAKCQ